MAKGVDWSKRADYVRKRHAIETSWADEAVQDAYAVWQRPDPASRSGRSVRVVGYSVTAGSIPTVILVSPVVGDDEHPDGDWWGTNAWFSNQSDRRTYVEVDDE
ncbi:hypothetical protein GCM10009676_42980 [Prauserella halophila]|uniref:Uncharacterized protein n=1 Tax=Prauserella halophila TaxID=185641 RepID=A0ABP4HB05_9PSEU|nr:hypothetical protein [Prauserella halophila]MCP2237831.1 hypothetical protein [Prauserella halophila]